MFLPFPAVLEDVIPNMTCPIISSLRTTDANVPRLCSNVLAIDERLDEGIEKEMANKCQRIHKKCKRLLTEKKILELDDGTFVSYDQCLVAIGKTGSTLELAGPIDKDLLNKTRKFFIMPKLSAGSGSQKQMKVLNDIVEKGGHVTIMGAVSDNFDVIEVAAELCATAAKFGYTKSVSIVCSSTGLLSQRVPRTFSQAINNRLKAMGMQIFPYQQIRYLKNEECGVRVFSGETYDSVATGYFDTDACVLIGTGYSSQKEFIDNSGLASYNGLHGFIEVNRSLQAAAGLYVAGDIAMTSFTKTIGKGSWSGENFKIETGRMAAMNMLGNSLMFNSIPYTSHNFNGSGIELTMVGYCSSSLTTHSVIFSKRIERDKTVSKVGGNNIINKANKVEEKTGNAFSSLKNAVFGIKSTNKDERVAFVKPVGKMGVKRMNNKKKADKIYETLRGGCGVIFYTSENGTIIGVLVSGCADKKSISVAKALVGKHLESAESSVMQYNGFLKASDSYSNQTTSFAREIFINSDIEDSKVIYTRSLPSAQYLRDYNRLNVPDQVQPLLLSEKMWATGENESTKDRLAAGYARGIAGLLELNKDWKK